MASWLEQNQYYSQLLQQDCSASLASYITGAICAENRTNVRREARKGFQSWRLNRTRSSNTVNSVMSANSIASVQHEGQKEIPSLRTTIVHSVDEQQDQDGGPRGLPAAAA